MSFSVGIVGLPNVGKSTLFKALTKQSVDISNYPFCTIDPNVGVVAVPDKRLDEIAKIIKPKKITPTVIEFVDIAGLVKGAHQGEGLGNQFLSHIRQVDAICQVVRNFINEKITHVEGKIDPQRDIEIVNTELIMKDLETISKRLEKTKKQARSDDKKQVQELETLNQIRQILEQGKLIKDQKEILVSQKFIQELGFLTAKPIIYLFNTVGDKLPKPNSHAISLDLKTESDISELSSEEVEEIGFASSKIDQLIKASYQALNLITFYTITGGQETRAWTLKKGSRAPQAGGVVHSDFEDNFIKAEVINWQKLVDSKTWQIAREKGFIRTEGKEYLVSDGDVIEFKI